MTGEPDITRALFLLGMTIFWAGMSFALWEYTLRFHGKTPLGQVRSFAAWVWGRPRRVLRKLRKLTEDLRCRRGR